MKVEHFNDLFSKERKLFHGEIKIQDKICKHACTWDFKMRAHICQVYGVTTCYLQTVNRKKDEND